MAELPRLDQDWVDEHVGITCDQCGYNRFITETPIRATDVTHTVPKNGVIHRRRRCRRCGYVMWTEERKVL